MEKYNLFLEGGQFKSINSYPSLVPNVTVFYYLYDTETLDGSPNAYLGKYRLCVNIFA